MGRPREDWIGEPATLGGLSRFSRRMLGVNLTIRIKGGREHGRRVYLPLTADEAENIGENLIAAAKKLREYEERGTQGPFFVREEGEE